MKQIELNITFPKRIKDILKADKKGITLDVYKDSTI